ncbi:GNAT family N-acetyltransferase [Edaphocola flava]|uniref:GNAT family N-acetyltransferase n=1 Tax=Edaphocola flava TaxID=2499629 RepID=UPI00100BB05E|nr:GNAT family N-acetyltransferase [Edaphocola flava]
MPDILLETERLLLREIMEADATDLFEMDSDPDVHRYIYNQPLKQIEEQYKMIDMLQQQYRDYGIARWAVVDKLNGECLGWAGLKFFPEPFNGHQHFYELGYRFKQKHWGKGYATEAGKAIVDYGFTQLNTDNLYAMTDVDNAASQHVLGKLGFRFIEVFEDEDGRPINWYALDKQHYNQEK